MMERARGRVGSCLRRNDGEGRRMTERARGRVLGGDGLAEALEGFGY